MSLYFYEKIINGLDINDSDAVTASIDISEFRTVSYEVHLSTGAIGDTVIQLQCSCDDVEWFNIANTEQTRQGIFPGVNINTRYVRAKVKTVGGGEGTVHIHFQAKK